MPSIPQSLLWISLVVLWLFVLVPMLTNRRDRVRRTSDVALSTRVLNGASRLARRGGPAAGHHHDPDWQRSGDHFDEVAEAECAEEDTRAHSIQAMGELTAPAEQDYLDVDVIEEDIEESLQYSPEDSPATEPVAAVQQSLFESGQAESAAAPEPTTADEDVYEYVEDTSGLEAEDEPADDEPVLVRRSSRERRLDSSAAVAVSARKYRFRMRMLTAMSVVMVITAVLADIPAASPADRDSIAHVLPTFLMHYLTNDLQKTFDLQLIEHLGVSARIREALKDEVEALAFPITRQHPCPHWSTPVQASQTGTSNSQASLHGRSMASALALKIGRRISIGGLRSPRIQRFTLSRETPAQRATSAPLTLKTLVMMKLIGCMTDVM